MIGFFASKARSNEIEWLQSAGIYFGLDFTKDQSPQCEYDSVDNNGTSNLGAYLNLLSYKNVELDFRYTHHSCALGVDRELYDGIGLNINWELWRRK